MTGRLRRNDSGRTIGDREETHKASRTQGGKLGEDNRRGGCCYFSCAGRLGDGGRMADAGRDHGGALCRRRPGRHHRTDPRRAPERNPGPAGHNRKRRWRRRDDRRRSRREVSARRLHRPALGQRRSRHQPDTLQEAALQRRHRLRACRTVFRFCAGADHAQGPSGQHAAGVRRLCQSQPGQDAIRLRRRRLGRPCVLHPPRRRHGHQDHPCAVSRRRAGDAGFDRRPPRLHCRTDFDGASADPGQRGEGDRHARARARARHRRSADRAGDGRFRSRLQQLGLVVVSQGHSG